MSTTRLTKHATAGAFVLAATLGLGTASVMPAQSAVVAVAPAPTTGIDYLHLVETERDRDLAALADRLHHWELKPQGTEGYRKAEVTAGGVDTRELSSQTMESSLVRGLYFIGEVVDVTGWLGGYNFQWAWASAAACAGALAASSPPADCHN